MFCIRGGFSLITVFLGKQSKFHTIRNSNRKRRENRREAHLIKRSYELETVGKKTGWFYKERANSVIILALTGKRKRRVRATQFGNSRTKMFALLPLF